MTTAVVSAVITSHLAATRWSFTTWRGITLAAMLTSATPSTNAGAQLDTARHTNALSLTEHLGKMTQGGDPGLGSRFGYTFLDRIDALVTQAYAAKSGTQYQIAIDDFAIAAVATSRFPQRDTIQQQLRTLLQQHGADGNPQDAKAADAAMDELLDHTFQAVYDREFPVTTAPPAASHRRVVAEYVTGTQCGPCWLHDRAFAALLRRYPANDLVVIGYHDGPGYPIVAGNEGSSLDSLWRYIGSSGGQGLYPPRKTMFGTGDFGWVDGRAIDTTVEFDDMTKGFLGAANIPQVVYTSLRSAIDQRLAVVPAATIALTMTPHGVTDTSLAAVTVHVRVTPIERRKHLGVRLILIEDTVRVTGLTNRRLQYMVARQVAWFGPPHQPRQPSALFFPLPAERTDPMTLTYTFDIATLQRALLDTPKNDVDARTAFPDLREWTMQPKRLGIVAIVQDQDTKEVLQSLYRHILPPQ